MHIANLMRPAASVSFFSTHGRRGAALVEYGITVGLIALIAIGMVLQLGTGISNTFTTVSDDMSKVSNGEFGIAGGDSGPLYASPPIDRCLVSDESILPSTEDFDLYDCFHVDGTSGEAILHANGKETDLYMQATGQVSSLRSGTGDDIIVLIGSNPSYGANIGNTGGRDTLVLKGRNLADSQFLAHPFFGPTNLLIQSNDATDIAVMAQFYYTNYGYNEPGVEAIATIVFDDATLSGEQIKDRLRADDPDNAGPMAHPLHED